MKRSKVRYDLFFLIVVIALSLVIIKNGLDRYDSLKNQENRLIKEIASGQTRKNILLSRLKELETDSHIEMVARRRLGYVMNSELAYKIIIKD
ncbi:MAG: septum formation initiator family protein [Candidatus Margulisiibacteriota bacterium]